MAEFPKIEEMSKRVAEKALDEFLYKGKSIREWIKIITSEDAISRQQVKSDFADWFGYGYRYNWFYKHLSNIPPVNPQEPCSNCCNGNQIEKAELCQKSYLAGMEHKQEQYADAISRQAVLSKIKEVCFSEEWEQFRVDNGSNGQRDFLINYIEQLSSVSSSEKPNKCDDAISRQMVLDATVNKNSIWNNITNAKGENLEKIILQLPSINQMNKWIGAEVLDDIRAEIENKYESISDTFHHYETGFTDALEWALSIIDKYKEE